MSIHRINSRRAKKISERLARLLIAITMICSMPANARPEERLPALTVAAGNDDMLPEAFTGILKYKGEARVTLMRVWLLRTTLQHGPTGGKVPITSAIVKLYLGGFNSSETFPIYYDSIKYDSLIGEIIFSESDIQRHDIKLRAPLLRMVFNPDHSKLDGDWISPDEGPVATVNLTRGWALDETLIKGNTITQRISGHYIGDCLGQYSSRLLRGIEIVSRRSGRVDAMNKSGIDTSTRAIDYVGGTYCNNPYKDQENVSCGGFLGGAFSHYRQELTLNFGGSWGWKCNFDSAAHHLSCSSPRYRRCELDQLSTATEPMDTKGLAPKFTLPQSFLHVNASNLNSVNKDENKSRDFTDCRKWNGKNIGILRNFNSGKYHHTYIQVTALPVDTSTPSPNPVGTVGEPVCKLVGFIHLGFGEIMDKGMESIHTAFDTVLHEDQKYLNLDAGPISDMIVKLDLSGDVIRGIWFSKIYGPVGQVVFRNDLDLSPLKPDDYVPELDGIFNHEKQNDSELKVTRRIEISSQRFAGEEMSFDPSRQILFKGSLKVIPDSDFNDESPGLRPTVTTIRQAFYDYHTGKFTLIGGSHLYHGNVFRDHLTIRDINIDEPNIYSQPGSLMKFSRPGE